MKLPTIRLLCCVLLVITLQGCQDNALNPLQEDTSTLSLEPENIDEIKKMFFSNEYDSHLYTELDDISTLYWKPLWDKSSIKKPTESISYLYVPLVPEVVEKAEDGSPADVKAINQRKFIIVKNTTLNWSLVWLPIFQMPNRTRSLQRVRI